MAFTYLFFAGEFQTSRILGRFLEYYGSAVTVVQIDMYLCGTVCKFFLVIFIHNVVTLPVKLYA